MFSVLRKSALRQLRIISMALSASILRLNCLLTVLLSPVWIDNSVKDAIKEHRQNASHTNINGNTKVFRCNACNAFILGYYKGVEFDSLRKLIATLLRALGIVASIQNAVVPLDGRILNLSEHKSPTP